MKRYVLYHSSCADGFGAAFAAWLTFGDEADYIPVQYGKEMPQIDNGSEVYILDFSYSQTTLLHLLGRVKKLVVLDHHATAQAELEDIVVKDPSLILFDMEKSGAVLAWEYFNPTVPVPPFFLYLQDRDLWQWKLPMSREVSDSIRSYPFDFKVWLDIAGFGTSTSDFGKPDNIESLWREGIGIRRMTKQIVEQSARNTVRLCVEIYEDDRGAGMEKWINTDEQVPFHDFKCDEGVKERHVVPATNCTVFISETCEKMLELHPTASFVASYFDAKDGKRVWSLRSRPEFDCSVIAKLFGGGGHKNAAGFTQ